MAETRKDCYERRGIVILAERGRARLGGLEASTEHKTPHQR
jgi:hypothetical protein